MADHTAFTIGEAMNEKLEKKQRMLAALALEVKMLRRQQAKKQKSLDTRRLVLIGALVSEQAKKNPEFAVKLKNDLEAFLVRPDERALFGFEALPEKNEKGGALLPL